MNYDNLPALRFCFQLHCLVQTAPTGGSDNSVVVLPAASVLSSSAHPPLEESGQKQVETPVSFWNSSITRSKHNPEITTYFLSSLFELGQLR